MNNNDQSATSQADAAVADAPPPDPADAQPQVLRRSLEYLVRTPALWTYLALIVLLVAFAILSGGTFATVSNFRNILLDGSLLLIISVGMTAVIITSGIDLSVGGVTIFASVVGAQTMGALGGDSVTTVLGGLVAAILAGIAWGAISGIMVGYLRIVALIATLGTLGMATGLAFVITGGVNVRSVPTWLVLGVGNGSFQGVPYLVIIAAIVAVIGHFFLSATKRGLYLYAIGSNEDAAMRAGVRVRSMTTLVYVIAGALAGLAGFLTLARFGTTALAGHTTDNLQAIAAVVLGGTSLFGGRGGIPGTVAGVFIPVVLTNGFIILGMGPFWQQFAIGFVLVLAVYADQLRRKRFDST
ncbi:MAG: ABC transporter permease [Beutenbergiaceae bacterium]